MSNKPNKRRQRTEELKQIGQAQMVNDVAVNNIEQYNFDKMVRSGVVVREKCMNFSEALKALKMGNKVSREAWRGRTSYWQMTFDTDQPNLYAYFPNAEIKPVLGLPIESILAEDWFLVT